MAHFSFNDVIYGLYNYVVIVEIIFWLMPEKGGGREDPKWWQALPVFRNWPVTEVW